MVLPWLFYLMDYFFYLVKLPALGKVPNFQSLFLSLTLYQQWQDRRIVDQISLVWFEGSEGFSKVFHLRFLDLRKRQRIVLPFCFFATELMSSLIGFVYFSNDSVLPI